jgi:tetrapyrrole methylase family protein/MazG family protein
MAVYLLEETYELVDAIESENPGGVCEELGDVLFLIVFIAGLFQEQGRFDLREVVRGNLRKMIRRHPHVFGTDQVDNADEVKQRWHQIKGREKNSKGGSSLDSIPNGLPAVLRAYRIVERAAREGFGGQNSTEAIAAVEARWDRLRAQIDGGMTVDANPALAMAAFGEVFLALVKLGCLIRVHPESALKDALKTFEIQFNNHQFKQKGAGL